MLPRAASRQRYSSRAFFPGLIPETHSKDCFEGLLPGSASNDCIGQNYRPDAAGPYHLNLNLANCVSKDYRRDAGPYHLNLYLANCVSKNYRPDAAGPNRPE